MTGIRSIGWWIPQGRRSRAEMARHYGLSEADLAKVNACCQPVAGPGDHPSTMGARATRAALDAAQLEASDLDCLIYAAVTRDYPAPWIGAFGVLHELGTTRTVGFDLSSRCCGILDGLWLAKTLIDSGTYKKVAICCAERFDYMFGPNRPADQPSDALYSAGAATAIVTADAANELAAFSNFINPNLSIHHAMGVIAGGSRIPPSEPSLREGFHLWRSQLSVAEVAAMAAYAADADRYNYPRIRKQAGFDEVDFVVCSPLYPAPQLEVLKELGVDPTRTLFTIPFLGHIGPADLLLILAVAVAIRKPIGRRIVLSTRTPAYAIAIALRAHGDGAGISVGGEGIDLSQWQ